MQKKLTIQLFFSAAILFVTGCSKKNSTPNTANLYIAGRVLEHGSNLPLGSAETAQRVCTRYDFGGCGQWDVSVAFSDQSGKFSFLRSKFRNHQVRKSGYWDFIDEPDACSPFGLFTCFRPADVTYYISAGQTDSVLIKLFPVTMISVRILNNGPAAEGELNCRAIRFGTRGIPVQLRAGLDSTFQFPVFGNTDNHLSVNRKAPYNDTVAVQTRFIAKTDVLNLDFFY